MPLIAPPGCSKVLTAVASATVSISTLLASSQRCRINFPWRRPLSPAAAFVGSSSCPRAGRRSRARREIAALTMAHRRDPSASGRPPPRRHADPIEQSVRTTLDRPRDGHKPDRSTAGRGERPPASPRPCGPRSTAVR
jgi:hypothetical protein